APRRRAGFRRPVSASRVATPKTDGSGIEREDRATPRVLGEGPHLLRGPVVGELLNPLREAVDAAGLLPLRGLEEVAGGSHGGDPEPVLEPYDAGDAGHRNRPRIGGLHHPLRILLQPSGRRIELPADDATARILTVILLTDEGRDVAGPLQGEAREARGAALPRP